MRRACLLLALTVAGAFSAAGAVGAGSEPTPIASYCSRTGDLCYGVVNRSGVVSLEVSTFAQYFSRYFLCVKPPGGTSTCGNFPISKRGSFYGSRVRWHLNFPARGPGMYEVTWRLKASPLGPRLRFRLPLS